MAWKPLAALMVHLSQVDSPHKWSIMWGFDVFLLLSKASYQTNSLGACDLRRHDSHVTTLYCFVASIRLCGIYWMYAFQRYVGDALFSVERFSWALFCVMHCEILWSYVDGLVQDCSNSIALAMELLQSCTKPSMCSIKYSHVLLCFVKKESKLLR